MCVLRTRSVLEELFEMPTDGGRDVGRALLTAIGRGGRAPNRNRTIVV